MSAAVCKISYKKLKFEDVLCPICREIYIEPIPLPCKHVVCLLCLEQTLENNKLVCPICRTRISTYIRNAKSLRKIIDIPLWETMKKQFAREIKKKLNGEEDDRSYNIFNPPMPQALAEKGSIKEEFDQMFHKLKIQEERFRRAEQLASEELVKQIVEEELELEKQRKKRSEELVKSDVLYIKSLIMSENGKNSRREPKCQQDGHESSSSSISNDHDSISDELRHFTPICIAPKTPPKRLPNGKLKDNVIIKPINLTLSLSKKKSKFRGVGSVKNKMTLQVLSNNFTRMKPLSNEDVKMEQDEPVPEVSVSGSAHLNLTITDDELPIEIIKEQELIQKRIKQEQEDMAIALKLHKKLNKEKTATKKKHGYQLRSSKKNGKKA